VRPAECPPLSADTRVDLAIVGGGFTGLWAALQAKEADPDRSVLVLEATSIGDGASGRNGGFAAASLTHGTSNGLHHFPDEFEEIEKAAHDNFEGFRNSIERHAIDARIEHRGVLSVATEPYQVEDLHEMMDEFARFGEEAEFLERDAVRAQVDSPTYCAGVWSRSGATVDPARLVWGLRDALLKLGVTIHERSPMQGMSRTGGGVELRCEEGRVRADKVVLAINAFRSPLLRMRQATIPVWDYVLMTEPLSDEQMASIGWQNRQGLADSANQFHYYRLSDDNRILWGGYDAIYHYGGRIKAEYQQRAASFEGLSRRFFDTFPQLEGLRFSHSWGGPIATTTRFCLDAGTAMGGRVSWAGGYTGLGVVASRYGARAALDLLDRPAAPHLALGLVRRRPWPWPPEPIRSIGVALTQRGLARADRNEGRRGLWLRMLDRAGLGFDS